MRISSLDRVNFIVASKLYKDISVSSSSATGMSQTISKQRRSVIRARNLKIQLVPHSCN